MVAAAFSLAGLDRIDLILSLIMVYILPSNPAFPVPSVAPIGVMPARGNKGVGNTGKFSRGVPQVIARLTRIDSSSGLVDSSSGLLSNSTT